MVENYQKMDDLTLSMHYDSLQL